MGDHEVILNDLKDKAVYFEDMERVYGEDLGAPYRDAADSLRETIGAYEATLPDGEEESDHTIELIRCGGCEKHSLLEDARAAAEWENREVGKPHCPRCGTRVEYDETTVETFDRRPVRSEIEPGDD